ncbi:MAG: hypothetical protein U0996_12735 [Planctomycetaceae bacterium]
MPIRKSFAAFVLPVLMGSSLSAALADDVVRTPRPVPATRPEMKELLEDMKKRPHRIPIPELTDKDKEALGERANNYEARLRYHYVPTTEGSVFGAARTGANTGGNAGGNAGKDAPKTGTRPANDFTRNADENMSLTYQFKTKLFWIVSRTNNCQYCLGHQEWKLSATGMTDDQIAALDADWGVYGEDEQAAFAYARLLTYEPHRLNDAAIESVKKFYSPLQILEMTMSVSGNNSINRWKEGTGIPQSEGNTFAGRGGSADVAHSNEFTTPTSSKYEKLVSIVAPLELTGGKATGRGVSTRPALESREETLQKISELSKRAARLTLVDAAKTADWLKESKQEIQPDNWARLLANFPNEGRGRLPALVSRKRQTGELTELQKAQINWIIARQDHAWYAIGQAYRHLKTLGQTDDQIFALDGDLTKPVEGLSDGDRSLFVVAKNLAASPIAVTDENVAAALAATSPAHVVQTINHTTACAYFDRLTEAAGLPLEE